MVREMQKDQKPEKVQISVEVYVDRMKDGQRLAAGRSVRSRPRCTLSHYLEGRTDKAEVQKNPNVSPQVYSQTTSREEGDARRA